MQLNNVIYGDSTTWYVPFDGYGSYTNRHPISANTYYMSGSTHFGTIAYGGRSNIIPKNVPLDPSVCYCGIPDGAPPLQIKTALLPESNGAVIAEKIQTGDAGAFAAAMAIEHFTSTEGDSLRNRWCFFTDVNSQYYKPNCQMYCIPLVNWYYNDVVINIYVKCGSSQKQPNNGGERIELKTYYEQYQNTYPYIYCVYGIAYIGDLYNSTQRGRYVTQVTFEQGKSQFVSGFGVCLNTTYQKPDSLNLPSAYADELASTDFYAYPLNGINHHNGFCYGFDEPKTLHTGDNDFSWASELYQCGIHRATDHFTYYVDGNTVNTLFSGTMQDILTMFAWFGLPFSDNYNSALNSSIVNCTDPHIYMPEIVDGYTTGNYKSGSAINTMPNTAWGNDWDEKNDYTGDPNEVFDLQTVLNTSPFVGGNTFVHSYYLDSFTAANLASYLYTTLAPSATSEDLLQNFLTNDPIKCIVNCIMLPFDFTYSANYNNIIMGNVDTNISAHAVTDLVQIIDMGSLKYVDKFKNFLSYEPYCTALLYIPYHGYTEILPSQYVGHTINVKIIVDLQSGSSIALVYRDGLVIKSLSGQIGTSVQLTGVDSATYNASMFNAINGYKQAKTAATVTGGTAILGILAGAASMTAGIATANPTLAMGGFAAAIGSGGKMANLSAQVERAEYQLNHVQIPFDTTGTSSPMSSLRNEQICRLIITRPKMLPNFDADKYGNTVGYACCQTGVISDFTGYTEVASADLSAIPCTATEKSEIMKLLQNGVYL